MPLLSFPRRSVGTPSWPCRVGSAHHLYAHKRDWWAQPTLPDYPYLITLSIASAALLTVFFQAEDGIRDDLVTGVQTCALPIFSAARLPVRHQRRQRLPHDAVP